jgi:hypothetical protein
MAIFTRTAGDAQGVNNVDATTAGALATIVATGLTKNPTAIKITLANSQVFTAAESGTGGAVETILRNIAIDSTIVMYQADTSQLSVLVEATGSATATIATRIQALGNVGAAANVYCGPGVAVTSTTGFKIA